MSPVVVRRSLPRFHQMRVFRCDKCLTISLVLLLSTPGCAREIPDIRSVEPDLVIPSLVDSPPAAGKRVRHQLEGFEETQVYHVLYLPPSFQAGKTYPVIVEFAGNGGYQNEFGDVSTGVPEGSKLGWGISGGQDFIWLCLPFITGDGQRIATQWWGSEPTYDPEPTVDYTKQAVAMICEDYGGNPDSILLCGFSRGAIACNFIGLHDDEIARLWCGFVAYSHYDGSRDWGQLPGADFAGATSRLARLGDRPQFLCHETSNNPKQGLAEAKAFLEKSQVQGHFTFVETQFRNHNDAWVLRDCVARQKLRAWVAEVIESSRQ